MKALKTWEPRPESSALRHSSTWDARSRQKLEEMWEDSDGDALQVLDLRPPELLNIATGGYLKEADQRGRRSVKKLHAGGRLTLPGSRGCLQSELKMNTRGLGAQLKDSIPVTELSASGPLESHDLRKGFSCVKHELLPSHPLELSEKNFQLNQDKMNVSTLRNIRGLFAPPKLQMEFKAVQQVQRLPFLPSSALSLDILRGPFHSSARCQLEYKREGEPTWTMKTKVGTGSTVPAETSLQGIRRNARCEGSSLQMAPAPAMLVSPAEASDITEQRRHPTGTPSHLVGRMHWPLSQRSSPQPVGAGPWCRRTVDALPQLDPGSTWLRGCRGQSPKRSEEATALKEDFCILLGPKGTRAEGQAAGWDVVEGHLRPIPDSPSTRRGVRPNGLVLTLLVQDEVISY
ncbi:hypothetical protein QTO34_012707 [Cnephaeus nilssonii]|uniref:Uncharacterized protein n=1 Tax=Cnephaeus nilssonii TaxID=3371016 RepID=A0AA40HB27_CNENI|nr:hypothetical protein QTO34_012707 [Eptesicus nilssonii]